MFSHWLEAANQHGPQYRESLQSIEHIYMDTSFISYLGQHSIASVNLQSK